MRFSATKEGWAVDGVLMDKRKPFAQQLKEDFGFDPEEIIPSYREFFATLGWSDEVIWKLFAPGFSVIGLETSEPLPDRDYNYFPTKFENEFDERVWGLSLEGWGIPLGSVEELGHYCIVEFDVDVLMTMRIMQFADLFDGRVPVGAIVMEDDRGFVNVEYYFTQIDLDAGWLRVEETYSEWYNQQEESDDDY